ncbi:MAG TPA: 2Fe-2S iron-sulfur cluster-binding protein [Symbiobacteriaceae bacterium]|jgi:NADH dehydrogenase/NADH:ubiquinone oxidoreductase subunit G
MEMVRLTIDGRPVEAPRGTTLRQAALQAGTHTPTLCHHEHLNCAANCRVCVVEVERARTLIPSCATPVQDGMVVRTDTDRVRKARRMVLELLMTEIDTTTAPEIQAYGRYYGADPARYPAVREAAKEREVIIDNPFYVRDYAKCMACMRCVRACGSDIQHTWAIAMTGHGHHISVGAGSPTNDITESPCVFCGNCVGLCPTGALMGIAEYEVRKAGLIGTPELQWSPETGLTGPGTAKEVI